jgi:hypothetical protein
VLPGACQWNSSARGYSCAAGSSAWGAELDAALKPDPVPAAGIWGDPQLFVLESRDADSETRNFGPVGGLGPPLV